MPLGGMELLIILVIILLFFGAKRVPELGRSLGRGMQELRKGVSEDSHEAELRKRQEKEEIPDKAEARLTEAERDRTEHRDSHSGQSP